MRRWLVCRAEIDHVLRTAALGKTARIFNVGVPRRRKLSVKIHTRLASQISSRSLGQPHEREHSCSRPVLCQRTGPGQLDGRIIAMTRYRVCSRRKAHGWYERNVKSTSRWPKLLFEAHTQITKPVGESRCCVVIEKVVWGSKTELGFAGDSKSHGRLGEIKATLDSIAGLLKAILKLQAAAGDDDTRTCDLRPVGDNRALRIGTATLSLRLESESSRRDGKEQTAACRR